MNSEDISPIMKKVLEKEMQRAKAGDSKINPTIKKGKAKPLSAEEKEAKEMSEWLVSEEAVIKQATEVMENLKNSIETDACPEFLKPSARFVIKRMEKIINQAKKNIEEMGEVTSTKTEATVKKVSEETVAKDGTTKVGEETASKATEDAASKATEETASKATEETASKATEETTSKVSEETASKATEDATSKATESSENKSSDFVKNLKPTPGQKNELYTYLGMTVVCAFLYALVNRNGDTVSISYDEFVKDFLLTRHAKSITVKYSGMVLVEIDDGLFDYLIMITRF